MRGKVAIATSAAAILVFPIAGCGGDDSTIQSVSGATSTSSAPAAVATDEFITAADARCAEANAAIANLSTDTAASSTTVQQQLSITKQTLSGLKALGEPEDPDGSLADFYSAMQDQISTLKQQQAALASGDTAASESLGVDLDQAMSDAEIRRRRVRPQGMRRAGLVAARRLVDDHHSQLRRRDPDDHDPGAGCTGHAGDPGYPTTAPGNRRHRDGHPAERRRWLRRRIIRRHQPDRLT